MKMTVGSLSMNTVKLFADKVRIKKLIFYPKRKYTLKPKESLIQLHSFKILTRCASLQNTKDKPHE